MHRYVKQYKPYDFSQNCISDIDECLSHSENNCSINARCINTDGGYQCECMEGFEGSGVECTGK